MISYKSLFSKAMSPQQEALTWEKPAGWRTSGKDGAPVPSYEALKVSAFYRAIELRSNSIGKYPICVRDMNTHREVKNHRLGELLWLRPNEAMTPFDYKSLVENRRLMLGNSYVWIYRDRNGYPV
ncbi:MAG: phage portal protein, partial [Oscillospiraceae bacterium]